METYRIIISDFDQELRTVDLMWVGRRFRWGVGCVDSPEKMDAYLQALADNTRKPLLACMELAATYAFPEAAIEIMTPGDVAKADAATE